MLLTITTTHHPATDLGYLLYKHPDRCQTYPLSFGQAHVFYPTATAEKCSACLLLDVDPVDLVRGKGNSREGPLQNYVNDRPYVCSSYLSVAVSRVFGSALQGTSKDRPDLAQQPIPLTARLDVLPIRGGESVVEKLFVPLGYTTSLTQHPLDEQFPEWGESNYYSLTISKTTTLSELLTHLYVLVPVFDHHKHYYFGPDEVSKLLEKGAGWLAEHPQRETITRRYLVRRPSLARQALAQLVIEESPTLLEDDTDQPETVPELTLNEQRHGAVIAALRASQAKRVLDLGCGEGKLLRELLKEKQLERIVGMDVSVRALEIATRQLKLDDLPPRQKDRIFLIHGSLMYRDKRLEGFDAALVVEVIEHLDPPRLSALERVVFEFARPVAVIVTTPNREYNIVWESLPADKFRHTDHRFEWTREEFAEWSFAVCERFGYSVKFTAIGPEHQEFGTPTQMGVFEKSES